MLFGILLNIFEILYFFFKGHAHNINPNLKPSSLIPRFLKVWALFSKPWVITLSFSSQLFTVLPFMPCIDFFH